MAQILVVTNASHDESVRSLEATGGWCPDFNKGNAKLAYFDSVEGLLNYIKDTNHNGPIIFMFFYGLDFIERTISSLIEVGQVKEIRDSPLEYSLHLMTGSKTSPKVNHPTVLRNLSPRKFTDLKFYFDASVCDGVTPDAMDYCDLATLASLVLSKAETICATPSLFIDDHQLTGGKDQCTRSILRTFPGVNLMLGSEVC